MTMKYRIVLVFCCVLACVQQLFAQTIWPKCPIIIQYDFDGANHCKGEDDPYLNELKVTNISENVVVYRKSSSYIGFISMGYGNGIVGKRIKVEAEIKNYDAYPSKEIILNKIGQNESIKFSDSHKCNKLTGHTESYRLDIYTYVDLPPQLNMEYRIKDNNTDYVQNETDKYYVPTDKPIELSINDYYVNEKTTCILQCSIDNGSNWKNLSYRGSIGPNGTISIYYSDVKSALGRDVLGTDICIRILKTTKFGTLTSETQNGGLKIQFLNSLPDYSYVAYKNGNSMRLYLPENKDGYKYAAVLQGSNGAGVGMNPIDGIKHPPYSGLNFDKIIVYQTVWPKSFPFELQLQVDDKTTELKDTNLFFCMPKKKYVYKKNINKLIQVGVDIVGSNNGDSPYVNLKFTDPNFCVPYKIERLVNNKVDKTFRAKENIGLSPIDFGEGGVNAALKNLTKDSIISKIYCLGKESNWLSNAKKTIERYIGSENVQKITCKKIDTGNQVFTHIEKKGTTITAYIFVFSNATYIPGGNSPQYYVVVIDNLPEKYGSEIPLHNTNKAVDDDGSTKYSLTANDITISASSGTLYFNSYINDGYRNELLKQGKEVPGPINLSFNIPDDIDKYYSFMAGNGNKLIVEGKCNPIDDRQEIYLIDMIGSSVTPMPGFQCGIIDKYLNCAYYDGHSINYNGKSVPINISAKPSSIKYAGSDSVDYVVYETSAGIKYRQNMVDDNTLPPGIVKTRWINELRSEIRNNYYNDDNKDGYKLEGITTNCLEKYRLTDVLGIQSTFDVFVEAPFFDNTVTVTGYPNTGDDKETSPYKYKVEAEYRDMGTIMYFKKNDVDKSYVDGDDKISRLFNFNNPVSFAITNLKDPSGVLYFKRTWPTTVVTNKEGEPLTDRYGQKCTTGEGENTINLIPLNYGPDFNDLKVPQVLSVTYCSEKGGVVIIQFDSRTTQKVELWKYNESKKSYEWVDEKYYNGKDNTVCFVGLENNATYQPRINGSIRYRMNTITINSEKQLFDFNKAKITNATTIEGKGSAEISVRNAIQDVTWTLNHKSESGEETSEKGNSLSLSELKANAYTVTASQLNGYCTTSKEFYINAPAIVGKIDIRQSNDTLYYSLVGDIDKNKLITDYYFKINKNKDSIATITKPVSNNTNYYILSDDNYRCGEYKIILVYKTNTPNDNKWKSWEVWKYNINYDELTKNYIINNYTLHHDTIYTIPYCYEDPLVLALKSTNDNPNFRIEKSQQVSSHELKKDEQVDFYQIDNKKLKAESKAKYTLKCNEGQDITDETNKNNPNTSLQLNNANNIYKSSHFDISFSRSKDYEITDLDKYRIDSLSAEFAHKDFLCSYSAQTDIKITNIKGGFKGVDEKQFENDNWRKDGEITEELHYAISYSGSDDHEHVFPVDETMENRSDKSYTCYFPGTYTVEIYDVVNGHTCKARQIGSETITRPSEIKFTQIEPTDPICEFTASGKIQVKAEGGISGQYEYYVDTVTFVWNTDVDLYGNMINARPQYENERKIITDAAYTFSNLYPGTYRITVLDKNKCVQTQETSLKKYYNPHVINATTVPLRCYKTGDGIINVIETEGTSAIRQFQLLDVNGDTLQKINANNDLLQYAIKIEGEDNNFTWKIKNELDDKTIPFAAFNSLESGSYNLALTDSKGCSTNYTDIKKDWKNVYVDEPALLKLTIIDQNNIIREFDKPGGSVTIKVEGGNEGLFNIFLDSKENLQKQVIWGSYLFDKFLPGIHTFYVTDYKGCEDYKTTLPMAQPESKLKIETTTHPALCNGTEGMIKLFVTGGWGNYHYTCDLTGDTVPIKTSTDTMYMDMSIDSIFVGGGHYAISVTDNYGAIVRDTVLVPIPSDTLFASNLSLPAYCGNDGTLAANIMGGTAPYIMFVDEHNELDSIVTNGGKTAYPPDIKIPVGTYKVIISDSNNCVFTLPITIADSSLVVSIKNNYPSKRSLADGRLEVVAQRGHAPYTYLWTNCNSGETCTSAVWNNVGAGVYRLKVGDVNSCKPVDTIFYLPTNGDLPLIIDTVVNETDVDANNGWVRFISDTAGFTRMTLHGPSDDSVDVISQIENQLRFEIKDLAPGHYLLVCVLPGGAVRNADFTIAEYKSMALAVRNIKYESAEDACNGSATLIIDGGLRPYYVKIARGGFFYADTVLNTNRLPLQQLSAQTYVISVIDGTGKSAETSFEIRKPAKPLQLHAEQTNPTCFGYTNGLIKLSATGGWGNYEYAADSGKYSLITTYPGRGAAVYTFVAVDRAGITDTLKVELVDPLPLEAGVDTVDSVSCFGEFDGSVTFDIVGGTTPYTVHYGPYDKVGNRVDNLSAGTHKFNVTDKYNCRTAEGSITVDIPQPDELVIANDSVTHTTCSNNNGQIDIAIEGGIAPYTVNWLENGLPTERLQGKTSIDSLRQDGLYSLVVVDANNCKTPKRNYRINSSSGPKITNVLTLPVRCVGDSTGTAVIDSADVIPATPYSPFRIEWPHGENTMSVNNLPAGWNEVFVIDSNNCKTSKSFNIGAATPIRIQKIGSREPSCYGYTNGQINVEVDGGVEGFRYLWNTGDTLKDLTGIGKGSYTIMVTDRNNCHDSATYSIGQPDSLHVEIGEENVLMCPDNTYEFIATAGFKTYSWMLDSTVLSTKRNLIASEGGEYYLEATYGKNCKTRDTVTITIGDDLLEADFYMASDAAVDTSLALVELSNMQIDSLRWEFNYSDFVVVDSSDYELYLKPVNLGQHEITLWAYSGGCVSYKTKQVEISQLADTTHNINLGYNPLIKSITVMPNPTKGQFSITVKLREEHDAVVMISSAGQGTPIERRDLSGKSVYDESFDLSNSSDGVYILKIVAGNEQRVVKVLLTK